MATQLAERSNKIVSELVLMLSHKRPNDASIGRLRDRVNAAINTLPMVLLQEGGPYIWKYRHEIKAVEDGPKYDWSVLDKDYSENYTGKSAAKEIDDLIKIIRLVVLSCTYEEQHRIYSKVREYLATYAEYRKMLKQKN